MSVGGFRGSVSDVIFSDGHVHRLCNHIACKGQVAMLGLIRFVNFPLAGCFRESGFHVEASDLKSSHIHVSTNDAARSAGFSDGLPHSTSCIGTIRMISGSWAMNIPDFRCFGRFFNTTGEW